MITSLDGVKHQRVRTILIIVGFGLCGIAALMETIFRTGWILLTIPVLIGTVFVTLAFIQRSLAWLISGSITLSAALGVFLGFGPLFAIDLFRRISFFLLSFGLGWGFLTVAGRFWRKGFLWWALPPAGIILGTGAAFFANAHTVLDFILYIGIGTGLSLLAWGIGIKLLGLIIPGSIVLASAPGIAISWRISGDVSILSQTGIMLIWFALGWGLITICSRVITDAFIWWPLIPAGVLAVVGASLYISGDPRVTISIFSNSTVMGVLIFGLYLLLMRSSFRW